VSWLLTPNMPPSRIAQTLEHAKTMLYCVSRRGVTGSGQSERQLEYLEPIRQKTDLPLALGFGITTAEQVSQLVGSVDVAVVGSALLSAFDEGGEAGFTAKAEALLAATR
ncbi:MAG: tryptophan synthase subunit alpha, partial [Pseudomonadales bacterium]